MPMTKDSAQIPEDQLQRILQIAASHRKTYLDILGSEIGSNLVDEIRCDYSRAFNKEILNKEVKCALVSMAIVVDF